MEYLPIDYLKWPNATNNNNYYNDGNDNTQTYDVQLTLISATWVWGQMFTFCWILKEENTTNWQTSCIYVDEFVKKFLLNVTLNLQIIIDKKVAKGVEIIKDNRKRKVFAKKEVVISAGAVNSPVLLMLSGVSLIWKSG